MEYIQKLPFILGASMAMIVGVINKCIGAETKTIYIRMSVGLVIFFILGLYIREFIYKLYDDIKRKEEEQKAKEKQEAANISKGPKSKVDYRVDDKVDDKVDDSILENEVNIEKEEKLYEEEFTPLSVNSIKLNKDSSK